MSTKPIPLTRSCPRCRNTGAYGYNATLSESEGQTSLCVKSLYATLHRYLVCTLMAPRPGLESCTGGQTVLEHPHVVDAYRDRPPAVQNGASHDRAVLGKGKGQTCCKLQARKVITSDFSAAPSWKMKSCGNRSTLRFTAWLRVRGAPENRSQFVIGSKRRGPVARAIPDSVGRHRRSGIHPVRCHGATWRLARCIAGRGPSRRRSSCKHGPESHAHLT